MEYLTVPEVAAKLRVSRKTLWNWHNQRKGPPVTKVGSKLLYKSTEVDRYLAASTHAASA